MTLYIHHYDAEKDETIFREMDEDELKQYEADQKAYEIQLNMKKSAKEKLLALGLTEEEIAAL